MLILRFKALTWKSQTRFEMNFKCIVYLKSFVNKFIYKVSGSFNNYSLKSRWIVAEKKIQDQGAKRRGNYS